MIKTRKHQAFSLIEISVVIVIIGILIAGISNGIDLYQDYRLTSARNFTKNSPVSRIPDLKLWLETTSEKAFKIGTTTNIKDYQNIALPNDQQDIGVWQEDVATKYPQEIAYQMNNFKPNYVKKGIGGLPSLYFDGNGDFMSFDGSLLSVWEDGFTIFVVERRTALPTVDTYQFLLSSSAISVGYNNATWIRIKAVGVSGFGTITSQKNQDRIHCHYQNTISNVIKISVNKKNYSGTTGLATTKIANGTAQIAKLGNNSAFYTGLISEIIIFARPLSVKELENVHLYLSNKYKIRLE